MDLELRTRASSLTTTIAARPPVNGSRKESQDNSGPGDFVQIRTRENGEGREITKLEPVPPVHLVPTKL